MESDRTDPKIAKMAFEAVYADKIDLNRRLYLLLHPEMRLLFDDKENPNYCDDEYVPDYCADPRLVIEAMRERDDWQEFGTHYLLLAGVKNIWEFGIPLDLMMNREGALALLALEWIEGRKG